MSEAKCGQCGTNNVEGSRFCAGCGTTLAASATPPRNNPTSDFASPPPLPPEGSFPKYAPPPVSAYQAPPPQVGPAKAAISGQAIASLILGITGFIMCGPFTAIPGIIVGKMELNAIRDGRSPQSNEGIAKAGYYVSIGVTALYTLILIVAMIFGLFAVLANR